MKTVIRTPLIHHGAATFLWEGARPPLLVGDFNDWDPATGIRLAPDSPGRWSARLELPEDAYMEYAFLLDGKRAADPHNPRRIHNGIDAENQYFYMPEGGLPRELQDRENVPHGQVTAHLVNGFLELVGPRHRLSLYPRMVYLYHPPAEGPCPLVVVYDGLDYLRRAGLPRLVDALIALGRIRPVALALVPNGGSNRAVEYACSDATIGFVRENVLPLARAHLDLVDPGKEPGAYGVLGASMGGLMALYTGLRLPEIFGRVLSQSGAFLPGFVLEDLVRAGSLPPLKVWMDVGAYEFLLEANRRMRALLAEHGLAPAYREFSGGHNYPSWRDDAWRGLEALFPPAQ